MSTKSGSMAEAVDALKEEVDAIITAPPTDEEMKRAKESILNSFIFNYTSNAQILGQQLTYAYYGYPADLLEAYQGNIEKVTKADVAAVAKKYIRPDEMVLLVVGNAADFDRPVSDFGEVSVLDVSIPTPPDTSAAVVRTAATLEAGGELFERFVGAVGRGQEPVETVQADYSVEMSMGGQTMSLGQNVVLQMPDRLLQTISFMGQEQTVVINGDKGYVLADGQKRAFQGEQATEELEDLNRDLLVLVSRAGDVEAVAAGQEEVDGGICDVVAVTLEGIESRLCIDADGMVVRQSYQGKHPMQQTPGRMEVTYSDYREVGGRMVPHMQVMTFDGQALATISVNSIEINAELDGSLFELGD
jgi:hypothetical protein